MQIILNDKTSNKRTCIVSSRKVPVLSTKRDEHSITATLCFGVNIRAVVYFGYEKVNEKAEEVNTCFGTCGVYFLDRQILFNLVALRKQDL